MPTYLDKTTNLTQLNITWLLNESRDIDPSLVERFATNRNVEAPAFYILILLYSLLIMIGTAGNTLVVSTTNILPIQPFPITVSKWPQK